ncbi:MAG: alanine:cation symporter family protein [Clostridiales bacterium]|nr:alanine:cation symporter family protein [Clostridiales bacterium]
MWTILIPFFLAEGLYFTVKTNWFPITKMRLWMKMTIGSLFCEDIRKREEGAEASQLQSICTVLAATIGTGNMAGVATAITAGGPGAIFWMWVSAFFGMMLTYAENVLGICYRYRDEEGKWIGGPMIYMERGCHRRWMAVIFSFLCIFVSIGMGNMTQINSAASVLESAFHIPLPVTGVAAAVIVGIIFIGGSEQILRVTERIVPIMAAAFFTATFLALWFHRTDIPEAFHLIIKEAFTVKASVSGVAGYGIGVAMKKGIARGVFTNEAGLGSSVLVNAVADVTEPVQQGMWAIFAVFFDTLVMCTLTALTILTSGVYNKNIYQSAIISGQIGHLPDGAVLTGKAFAASFGIKGEWFVAVCIVCFAFATILAWSYYGEKTANYLFGAKSSNIYKLIFLAALFAGSQMNLRIVWELSDLWNAMMAIPNLAAVAYLSKDVIKATRAYIDG